MTLGRCRTCGVSVRQLVGHCGATQWGEGSRNIERVAKAERSSLQRMLFKLILIYISRNATRATKNWTAGHFYLRQLPAAQGVDFHLFLLSILL